MTVAILIALYLAAAVYVWTTDTRVEMLLRRNRYESTGRRVTVFLLSPLLLIGSAIDSVYRPLQRAFGKERTRSFEHAVIRRLFFRRARGYAQVIADMVRETDSKDIDRVAKELRAVLFNENRSCAVAALLSVTADVLGGNTTDEEKLLLPKLAQGYGDQLAEVSRIFALRRALQ